MIRKSYRFKFSSNKKRAKRLTNELWQFWEIWNECIFECRRQYGMCGKIPSKNNLQKHLKQLIDSGEKPLWGLLGYSQAIQNITERVYKAYEAFFNWAKDRKGPKKKSTEIQKNPQTKKLYFKTSRCEQCGLTIDRDFNIAINIKNEGMSSLGLDRIIREETFATVV